MTDVYDEELEAGAGYGRGARILSIGIAATGVLTLLYFALSSHLLGPSQYGSIADRGNNFHLAIRRC